MKSKVYRGLKMFGPYLINRDLVKCQVIDNAILTKDEGVYAEKLTRKSRYTLESLALGENKTACVFFTPIPPNVNEVIHTENIKK